MNQNKGVRRAFERRVRLADFPIRQGHGARRYERDVLSIDLLRPICARVTRDHLSLPVRNVISPLVYGDGPSVAWCKVLQQLDAGGSGAKKRSDVEARVSTGLKGSQFQPSDTEGLRAHRQERGQKLYDRF